MEEVLKVEGLCKRYGRRGDYAIENVTFSCHVGEIVGLLGHNGAGKSTTLKCLEGMLPYDKGKIEICGHDVKRNGLKAKSNMGFVTDNHAVFLRLTGVQYLSFMADVYGVSTRERQKRIKEIEEVFRLGDAVKSLISSYSHGMRQKICMMGSLLHRPKLWVLDEPMTGLDPRTMRAVRDYMKSYAAEGHGILFSSHALETVTKVCDRAVLIRRGKQIDELSGSRLQSADFDIEEYFLEHENI